MKSIHSSTLPLGNTGARREESNPGRKRKETVMSTLSIQQDENLASTASPVFALFKDVEVEAPDREHLALLASGALSAIRVPGFFSSEECQEIMNSLQSCQMGSYDEQRVQPRVPKLGPAVYDYYGGYKNGVLPDSYWEHSRQSEESLSRLLFDSDPLDIAMEKLRQIWGQPVSRATSNGRQLFAGMIREINNSMKLHFDDIVREIPGGLDTTPMCQLAFNVHLSMPASGGESVIHQRRWRPTDELPENRDTYGYAEHIVADDASVSVRAEVGDATFFDSRNYHLVRRNTSDGRRVTLSFFIGVTGMGPIVIWS
ncbi:hypothetical protein [Streptomyces sp. NPDC001820]|uniref:2OG-Fe(II)-dependent halogenase WelO5 family protein n=1 Tax=Streptomyces sp. NPDC001820 TaxID=3364613 RepID=UPI0036A9F5FB